jgi:hypothetical protein
MAAGTLPTPGSKFGPCVTACAHRDCAETRKMAAAICEYCNGPIAYETRFYDRSAGEGHTDLVHATCAEVVVETGLEAYHDARKGTGT